MLLQAILFGCFFLSFYLRGTCQQIRASVEYNWTVKQLKTNSTDKVPVERNIYVEGKKVETQQDSVLLSDVLSKISFQQIISTNVYGDCSYITYSKIAFSNLSPNTPDTLVGCNGEWVSIKNKERKNLPVRNLQFQVTSESKQILGYDCIRIEATDLEGAKNLSSGVVRKYPME